MRKPWLFCFSGWKKAKLCDRIKPIFSFSGKNGGGAYESKTAGNSHPPAAARAELVSGGVVCRDLRRVLPVRIEQARVEGTDEVLGLLFQRLEIPWRESPEFCGEAGVWFEGWYDRLFAEIT